MRLACEEGQGQLDAARDEAFDRAEHGQQDEDEPRNNILSIVLTLSEHALQKRFDTIVLARSIQPRMKRSSRIGARSPGRVGSQPIPITKVCA